MPQAQYAWAAMPLFVSGVSMSEQEIRRVSFELNRSVSVHGFVRRCASITASRPRFQAPLFNLARCAPTTGRTIHEVATVAEAKLPSSMGTAFNSAQETGQSTPIPSGSRSADVSAEASNSTTPAATTSSPGGGGGSSSSSKRRQARGSPRLSSSALNDLSSVKVAPSRRGAVGAVGVVQQEHVTSAAEPGTAPGAEGSATVLSSTPALSTPPSGGTKSAATAAAVSRAAAGKDTAEQARGLARGGEETARDPLGLETRCRDGNVAAGQEEDEEEDEDEDYMDLDPTRLWCASCQGTIPAESLDTQQKSLRVCAGCHRWYHSRCADNLGGGGWSGGFFAFLQALPMFQPNKWYHSKACQQVRENLDQFADQGELELPGARTALLDAATDEEVPYFTLRLFRSHKEQALASDPDFLELVRVLRRYSPPYVPRVVPEDCLDFDYGLVVWKDRKAVAAAMFDVYGEDLVGCPLMGARDAEGRWCLMEAWGDMMRDSGLRRVSLEVPEGDEEEQRFWREEYGFTPIDPVLLEGLSKEIPAYSKEMQQGTAYLVRDLLVSPEIIKSPEDLGKGFVMVDLPEDVRSQALPPPDQPGLASARAANKTGRRRH